MVRLGGSVELHLDPADSGKIRRVYQPFCTFAIAFQEITASCHVNDSGERKRWRSYFTIIPIDLYLFPLAQCCFNDPYRNTIQSDILSQKCCSHGFYCNHIWRVTGSTDTKCPNICTDIDDTVMVSQVIEPVFRYFKDLAEGCLLQDKSGIIR